MGVEHPESKPGAKSSLGGRSSLLLAVYLVALTAAVWGLVRHVLKVRLTESLALAVTAAGAEWVMYLLIALSVFSGGVILERVLFYQRRAVDIEAARSISTRPLSRTPRAISLAGASPPESRFGLEAIPSATASFPARCC